MNYGTENNHPVIVFSSDSNIAKFQSDVMSQGISAKVEMHSQSVQENLGSKEIISNRLISLYVFLFAITALLCLFSFLTSETFLELARERKVSRAEQLKQKKAALEKEIESLEGEK